MIDGIRFRDWVILLDLGIDGQQNPPGLGLREGSTERCCAVQPERSATRQAACANGAAACIFANH